MARSLSKSISRERSLKRCPLLSPIYLLPIELIDAILGFCDVQTLLAASLVCRSWLPYNRYHLFSHNKKRVYVCRENADAFASVLQSPSNSISPFINRLALKLSDHESDEVSDETLWLSDLIIPALASVKVTSLTMYLLVVKSDGLPAEVHSSLSNTFKNIRELKISYVNYVSLVDAVGFACSFPQLEVLNLKAVVRGNFLASSYRGFGKCRLPKGLVSLGLHFPWAMDVQSRALSWLLGQECGCLKRLAVNFVHHAAFPLLERYISGLRTLKHLTLDNVEVENGQQRLDLAGFQCLTSVKLFPFVNSLGVSPVGFIYNSLSSIPLSTSLKSVIVFLLGYDIPANDPRWESLDELLAFGKHQGVVFGSRTTIDARFLSELLPRCGEAGKLDIVVF